MAAAILFTSTGAMAADGDAIYYSGSFQCDKGILNTDWVISRDLAGQSSVAVYYQQRGSDQVQWLQLKERQASDGNVLVDDNGQIRLALSGSDDAIKAAWVKGPPYRGCQAFEVKKVESVKERFDRLFTLLETPHPTKDEERQASEALTFMPIAFALPELDQQPYMQRLAVAVPAFWQRYRDGFVGYILSHPLASEAERASYVEQLHITITEALPSLVKRGRDRKVREDMTLALQMASDRLADAGYPVAAAYDTTNIQTMCGRFSLMNKSFYQIDDLEFIVGTSFDYWTRDIAENVIRSAKSCGDAEHYVGSLMEQWPRIQEKQTTVTVIKAERDRVLAMPLTFATLIETKNAQPDRQKVNIRYGEQDILKRFFGKPLDAHRDALFDAAINEINNSAASYAVEHPESAKELSNNCEQLRYLDGLSDDRAKHIGEACQSALTAIAQRQIEDGVNRINTALQASEQQSGTSNEARKTCQALGQAPLLRDAIPPLRDACEAAERTLKQKEEAQRCIVAIEKSGEDTDFLETTIVVKSFGQNNRTTIKELVCTAAKHDFQLSFRTEGALLWSKQLMELRRSDIASEGFAVELTSAEDAADWKVSSWVGDQDAGPNDTPLDEITACLMRAPGCSQ